MDRHSYLHILAEQIRTKRARPMVIKEVEAHIEDQKLSFIAERMTAAEAEEAAVREMGDPVEAGVALDRVHRPKMEWGVLAGVIFISLVGLVIQIAVILTAYPKGSPGRFQAAAVHGGAGDYVMAMAAGLILMLIICLVDYTLIDRFAVIFWVLLNALIVLCIMTAPTVNGRPLYLLQLASLLVPFYAGMLYHFRGQGQKGLIKSGICLCISLLILLFNYTFFMMFTVGAVGLILIHAAIYKKWFGNERKKLYLKLWFFIVLAGGVVFGLLALKTGGRILADYQIMRIKVWLHPEKYMYEENYLATAVAEAGTAVRDGSVWLVENMMREIRNSYLWLYMFRYLGTRKGLLITAFVFAFWIFLFCVVRRQKNQLGYIVSLGCVLFLSFETLMYIGMNFGFVPMGAMYMPFFSNGGSYLIISYFYMGLILSVCRNSSVVKN